MTPEAWSIFESFRGFHAPNSTGSPPGDWVVVIGAGFDTRAFRLCGGRWVELDEPALITLKEAHLPARTFTHPTLICDLTTRGFARRYGGKIGKRFRELGAPYGRLEREPLELIEAPGFRLKSRVRRCARRCARYSAHPALAAGDRAAAPARWLHHCHLRVYSRSRGRGAAYSARAAVGIKARIINGIR
jgi:hypothetical protein